MRLTLRVVEILEAAGSRFFFARKRLESGFYIFQRIHHTSSPPERPAYATRTMGGIYGRKWSVRPTRCCLFHLNSLGPLCER